MLGIEGLNTAVEKIADFIHPEFHERIGFIKDIAAGAVFFAAMTAIAVAVSYTHLDVYKRQVLERFSNIN